MITGFKNYTHAHTHIYTQLFSALLPWCLYMLFFKIVALIFFKFVCSPCARPWDRTTVCIFSFHHHTSIIKAWVSLLTDELHEAQGSDMTSHDHSAVIGRLAVETQGPIINHHTLEKVKLVYCVTERFIM